MLFDEYLHCKYSRLNLLNVKIASHDKFQFPSAQHDKFSIITSIRSELIIQNFKIYSFIHTWETCFSLSQLTFKHNPAEREATGADENYSLCCICTTSTTQPFIKYVQWLNNAKQVSALWLLFKSVLPWDLLKDRRKKSKGLQQNKLYNNVSKLIINLNDIKSTQTAFRWLPDQDSCPCCCPTPQRTPALSKRFLQTRAALPLLSFPVDSFDHMTQNSDR